MVDRKSTRLELQSHRDLHSFPTRRSSDLMIRTFLVRFHRFHQIHRRKSLHRHTEAPTPGLEHGRSEEHTSGTPVTQRSTLFPYTTLFRSDDSNFSCPISSLSSDPPAQKPSPPHGSAHTRARAW